MTAGDRTVLRWAGATDVGTVRSNNEDRYLLQPEQRLWVVADGMGGHRGGEVASQIACDTLAQSYRQSTVDGLVQAINAANAAVVEAGSRDPELSGMGTTVVTLAVVTSRDDERTEIDSRDTTHGPGDEMLAIANVGDSRAYRFAEGELQQLTEDHSLVADMVREGSISQEEAESHPQKNIVTRALGVAEEIPVDVFTMPPRPGDRYLLCSDGLSDELPVHRMAAVLRRLTDTNEVADELIRLAVEAGARDNVTVVVVDVMDVDNNTSDLASGAFATDPVDSNELRPITGHAYAEPQRAEPYRRRRDGDLADDALDDDDAASPRRGVRRPRRFSWRVAVFLLLVVGVLGGAVATIQWYGRSTYYVAFSGDEVAIYQGRPGGVLWIEPKLIETSPLHREEVPADAGPRLEAGLQHASLDDAQDYVTRLEQRAQDLQSLSGPPES